MASLNYSRQREAIRNFLASRTDHPTADIIYTSLRREYPNISLGTVYRNLSLLEEIGAITRISTRGVEHYDADLSPHQHFICTRCHQVSDVRISNLEQFLKDAYTACPGSPDSCQINFHGICKTCSEENTV